MKFAYQTIIWGPRPVEFRGLLSDLNHCGFQGVEIAQAKAFLPPPGELHDLLQAYDLQLLALCGGRLEDRFDYCAEGHLQPLYYYVERLDERTIAFAQEHGCRLALHPHVYTEIIQPDKTREQLEQYPDVLFLPDTAHLYMAHVDAIEAIGQYANRLASVHLKDWVSLYGRSCPRYARGFTQLGEGEVHPEHVLHHLQQRNYDGWVVIECDYAKNSPRESVEGAVQWLRRQRIGLRAPILPPDEDALPLGRPLWLENAGQRPQDASCAGVQVPCLYRELFRHVRTDSLEAFGESVLRYATALIPSAFFAQMWEYSPSNRLLGLLAEYPRPIVRQQHFIQDVDQCAYDRTINRGSVTRIDPAQFPAMRERVFADRLGDHTCEKIITVPVFNSCNPNHIQLVLSFGLSDNAADVPDAQLLDYAEIIAIAYEIALDDLCLTFSSAIEQHLSTAWRFDGFLQAAAQEIRTLMKCEGVTIFLADNANKRLEFSASTDFHWQVPPERRFYERGDGSRTGKVWETNEPILLYGPRDDHIPKSVEVVAHDQEKQCLIFPMRDSRGQAIGVLRCRNRTEERQMFAESDMAIAEAICQSIVPNLLTLRESFFRIRTIDRMIHELKVPLTAIRGAAEVLDLEARKRAIHFKYDYVGDICSWLDLQEKQIRRVDFYRYKFSGRDELLTPKRERVLLLADVVAPTIRHTRFLLKERNFSSDHITHDDFYNVPPLYLDKAMFQQVFFNLLGNAIKYCYKDPDSFSVRMHTDRDARYFLIHFEDWGLGIPAGYEKVIFEPYVRAPGTEQYNVSGDGLGLWVVRQVLEAHGGQVSISNLFEPTRITLALPKELAENPALRLARH